MRGIYRGEGCGNVQRSEIKGDSRGLALHELICDIIILVSGFGDLGIGELTGISWLMKN